MPDKSENAETPRQKLAQEARQKDMQAANDGARSAAQTSVLINGGAATAILAFLSTYLSKGTTSLPNAIFASASWSLLFYAVGVCLGAWSLWSASQACAQFGLRWEAFLDYKEILDNKEVLDSEEAKRKRWQSLHEKQQAELNYLNEGNRRLRSHRNTFALSILVFVISSATMAYGFLARA